MHTWTVLYDTPAASASGKVGGAIPFKKGGKSKKNKPKTLKQYAVDDGALICVRDLRDNGGGGEGGAAAAPDYFMRFEDECAKQGWVT